ncbi:MAG: hypothetical protein SFV15_16380 [Polyangiaceae bacterium]|nr:hypothetical protein [Polyangiaceae bacterium]
MPSTSVAPTAPSTLPQTGQGGATPSLPTATVPPNDQTPATVLPFGETGSNPGGACAGIVVEEKFVPLCPQGNCSGPRVGDPGSVFAPELASADYPFSLETTSGGNCDEPEGWARAGVEGGIPELGAASMTAGPGDDLQAALNSLAQPVATTPRILLLRNGCYELGSVPEGDALLTVPTGVVLRGESRDGVVLSFNVADGTGKSSIRVNGGAGLENLTVTNAFVLRQPEEAYVGRLESGDKSFSGNYPDLPGKLAGVALSGKNAWMQHTHIYKTGTNPVSTWGCNHCTLRDNIVEKSYNKGVDGNGYYYIGATTNSLFYHESVSDIRHFAFNTLGSKNCNNVILSLYTEVDINYHSDQIARTLVENVVSNVPASHYWGREEAFGFNGKGMNSSNLHYKINKFPDLQVYRFTSDGQKHPLDVPPPASGTLYPVSGWR